MVWFLFHLRENGTLQPLQWWNDSEIMVVHYHSNWKRNQSAVCWAKLSRAQDQGLHFWQTKSHTIIEHSPVPADCIKKSNLKTEIEYCSTGTRRLVRDPEPAVDTKPQFEIDLRVEGVSQDAILQG